MKTVFDNIKGDRIIWAIAALLAIFSFLPVYSAASNLAYTGNGSNTFSYFIKHFVHLFLGFSIIYGVHKIPYRYFRGLSLVMIPVSFNIINGHHVAGFHHRRGECQPMDSSSNCRVYIPAIHIGCFGSNGICGTLFIKNK